MREIAVIAERYAQRCYGDPAFEPLMDICDNEYNTVGIGNQIWTVENLKTTKYADDTNIPNITDFVAWMADVTGAYCWYNNQISNKTPYGALYNWFAVNNAKGLVYFTRNGVQEAGWRVPTFADLETLRTYLGGWLVAGGKLKEIGIVHWGTPNTGATDEYGFTLLPGGEIGAFTGGFDFIGKLGTLYTSELDPVFPYIFGAGWTSAQFSEGTSQKTDGYSIRCVKDL